MRAGVGSGFADGATGSGSAAGTATLAFGKADCVTAAVCVVGVELLPGRMANSVQPHASPIATAARPRKISRMFVRSI